MTPLTASTPFVSLTLDRPKTALVQITAFAALGIVYYVVLKFVPFLDVGGTVAGRAAFALVVAVSGLLASLYALRFFAGGPVIVVDRDGVHDRRLTRRPLVWSVIRSIGPADRLGQRFVALDTSPEALAAAGPRLSLRIAAPINRFLGNAPVTIQPTGVVGGIDAILKGIEDARPAAGRGAAG